MSFIPNETVKKIFFISITATHAVLIPVCLYWMIRYIKIAKTQQCCKARHSIIIDILIIIQTNAILYWVIWKWIEIDRNWERSELLLSLFYLYTSISFVILTTKYSQHVLKLYVNSQFVIFVNNKKWIQLIGNIKTKVNWFIKNRDKYVKYNNKVINAILVIQIMVSVSLKIVELIFQFIYHYEIYYFIPYVWGSYCTMIIVLPIIFTVYLFCKVKMINDNFYIIKQFKYCAIITIICCFVILSSGVTYFADFGWIILAVDTFFAVHLFPCLLLFNTCWVIKYVIPKVNTKNGETNGDIQTKRVYLSQILNNSFALDVFMKHLSKEFSIEMLLSYIEMRQYELYVMKTLNIDSNDNILRKFPNIPISSIITKYDNNDKLDEITKIKYIALELFYKYIEHGSEYEININYDERTKLGNYMNNQQYWFNISINTHELFNLFSDSCKQIHKLLGFSLQRMHEKKHLMNELESCFDNNKHQTKQ